MIIYDNIRNIKMIIVIHKTWNNNSTNIKQGKFTKAWGMSTSSLVLFGLKVKPTPNRVPWKKWASEPWQLNFYLSKCFLRRYLMPSSIAPKISFQGKQRNIIVDRVWSGWELNYRGLNSTLMIPYNKRYPSPRPLSSRSLLTSLPAAGLSSLSTE